MSAIEISGQEPLMSYLRDMWSRRELFWLLAWRDFSVRYKQSLIGAAWALIKPVLTMITFVLVFGYFVKAPSGGMPYPLLVCCGILPWQLFSSAFSDSSNSLMSNSALITKVYFPRLLVPFSAVVVSLIDFLISCVLLMILMVWYGVYPSWRFCVLPSFVFLAVLIASATGIWMAALTANYRDFRHLSPFIMQFGLYVSPVGFSSAVIPEKWQILYHLNPMATVIDGFRWVILGEVGSLNIQNIFLAIVITTLLLVSGIYYFRKMESTLADNL